ncbi:AraC family transcriptional regulator [uncultured Sphaerochaeta sp.]|uniref:helix-turn-helix transcriptional regulator n=1 Tax=uncultured Sphaerochaeta sp. TaxID=886478 RepID=UPI002A0A53B6|nr:AraC family transcriptional regulator [uncultured Sphaerochaeta sp.]
MSEERHIYFDEDLLIEAYSLQGIIQEFPNHFHSFYVIGCIENGCRHLQCKGTEYTLGPGNLILFNPEDNHTCAPLGIIPLDYRALNIDMQVLEHYAYEITGKTLHPYFTQNVVIDPDLAQSLSKLYDLIVEKAQRLEKEEALYVLLEQLILQFCNENMQYPVKDVADFQNLQDFVDIHFAENISLDQLSGICGYSKSYLIRSFTRKMGVSPYRYLQNVRLEKAKKMLQEGNTAITAALSCGFNDQSHFANTFKRFIGLTPNQYRQIFLKK